MLAHTYFQLLDAITAARHDEELDALLARVAATAMHPFERRELERQLRLREYALLLEL